MGFINHLITGGPHLVGPIWWIHGNSELPNPDSSPDLPRCQRQLKRWFFESPAMGHPKMSRTEEQSVLFARGTPYSPSIIPSQGVHPNCRISDVRATWWKMMKDFHPYVHQYRYPSVHFNQVSSKIQSTSTLRQMSLSKPEIPSGKLTELWKITIVNG